jgi:hypothetical protein
MFAVLGYQTTDVDVRATIRTVREHLAPGGPFVFDVWYGPAVEAIGPSMRTKVTAVPDGEIERQASGELRPDRHLCRVTYRLVRRRPGQPDTVTEEEHTMRYFFPGELEGFLAEEGLSLERIVPFPDTGEPPSDATWNVLATAFG